MSTELKTIDRVIKKDKPERVLKESGRIRSWTEEEKRKRFEKDPRKEQFCKFFNVWYISPAPRQKDAFRIDDEDIPWLAKISVQQDELTEISDAQMEQAQKDETRDTRPIVFRFHKQKDLLAYVDISYKFSGALESVPELVIMKDPFPVEERDRKQIPKLTRMFRGKVSEFINENFVYLEDEVAVENWVLDEAFHDEYCRIVFEKADINLDNVIEYSLGLMRRQFIEDFAKAGVEYYAGNSKALENCITEEMLKSGYQAATKVDTPYWKKDYQAADFLGSNELEELHGNEENYLKYRRDVVDFMREQDFDSIKEQMRQRFLDIFKMNLDNWKPHIQRNKQRASWDARLLQPIIVAVSKDPNLREQALASGANLITDDLDSEEIEKLIEFVARIKSNPASLATEEVRQEKKEFYELVQGQLEDRSEITAETDRELSILQKIFNDHQVRKVLDVGCGYGRISAPLLEQGYAITGLDSNEDYLAQFRSTAKKLDKSIDLTQGDLIDYHDKVKPKSQDAVIYTWHSILEAFGPGNLLKTLNCAWQSLEPGGVLVFDQPTRENQDMKDGWYGKEPEEGPGYLSYIMSEEEIRLVLKLAGFQDVEIIHWQTRPSQLYPEGMKKITVKAEKPEQSHKTEVDLKIQQIQRRLKPKKKVPPKKISKKKEPALVN